MKHGWNGSHDHAAAAEWLLPRGGVQELKSYRCFFLVFSFWHDISSLSDGFEGSAGSVGSREDFNGDIRHRILMGLGRRICFFLLLFVCLF